MLVDWVRLVVGVTKGPVGKEGAEYIGLVGVEGKNGDREKNEWMEGEKDGRRKVSLWIFPLQELQQTAHWTVSR